MLAVAVLTIVSFVLLYNTTQIDELASTQNPKIYGTSLNPILLERQVKNYQLAIALGQIELLSKMGGTGEDSETAVSEFVWNLLVFRHEAAAMGIRPTDKQVEALIKTLPLFQTSGQFDPTKYADFSSNQLAPRGFTERQLEEILRDSLSLERVSDVVCSPIAVGDDELRGVARILQTVTASFVKFDAAAAAAMATVPAEDIAAYHERNKTEINTKENRVVRYVAFDLPAGHTLEGREKVEEMQKLANAASGFAESLGAPGRSFAQTSAAAGLAVRSTPAFDRSGTVLAASQIGGEATKQIESVVQSLAPAAFLLQDVGKTSDVIQAGDGFYVAELSELTPARPLTLAEATQGIEARLRAVQAEKILSEEADAKILGLREAVAAGKSFDEAAAQAGLPVESFANLSPVSESLTPEQRLAASSVLGMKDGEISQFRKAPWGGICVYLKTRDPLDGRVFDERREEIRRTLLANKRNLLFAEWLRTARTAAKITLPQGRQN